MKKTSTILVNGNMIFKGHKLTIGLRSKIPAPAGRISTHVLATMPEWERLFLSDGAKGKGPGTPGLLREYLGNLGTRGRGSGHFLAVRALDAGSLAL